MIIKTKNTNPFTKGESVKRHGELETVNVPVDSIESLAVNIAVIATATRKMMSSGLQRKTIIYLLSRSSGVGLNNINLVLDAMENMDKDFLKDEGSI